MIVREAQERDLGSIAKLAGELALHVEDADPGMHVGMLRENLLGRGRWAQCFVVTENNDVIAFAVVCRQFEAHTRSRCLWISDLAVSKRYQNRSVGRFLFTHLKKVALELECRQLKLELWSGNETARLFYERLVQSSSRGFSSSASFAAGSVIAEASFADMPCQGGCGKAAAIRLV